LLSLDEFFLIQFTGTCAEQKIDVPLNLILEDEQFSFEDQLHQFKIPEQSQGIKVLKSGF